MTRKEKVLVVLGVLCLFIASASFAGPGIGSPAPGFTLPDSAGVNRSLSNYSGMVRMINFWAAW